MIAFQDACAFVAKEAELLDRKDYAAWTDLWTDDGLYIIPVGRDETDFANSLNLAYDDADMRRMRTTRLSSKHSVSAVHAAITVRTLGRFVEGKASKNKIELRAAQHLIEYRSDEHRLMAADVEYEIRKVDGELKLARKIIRLVNSESALHALGYLP